MAPRQDGARPRRCARAALVAAMASALAGAAFAQSGSSTLSGFQQGFNGGLNAFESQVNVSTYANGTNTVFVDGVSQIGSDQSVFSKTGATTGASDKYSGAGAIGGATAIGNNLNVNVSGEYNTVVVNSTQVNNGNISASTVLNGKVNLDAGQ